MFLIRVVFFALICGMFCGHGDSGVSNTPENRAVGPPGKKGPKGAKGERGEKGAKGSYRVYDTELAELRRIIPQKGSKGERGQKGSKGSYRVYESELANLRRQISELTKKKCHLNKYYFPRTESTSDYIRIKKAIPTFYEITICTWFTTSDLTGCPLVSYATSTRDNAFLLYFVNSKKLNIWVNGDFKSVTFGAISGWTHMCVTYDRGYARTYIDGNYVGSNSFSSGSSVTGGGSLVIGQEQDSRLGGFDDDQTFSGYINKFMIWYRRLGGTEIQNIYSNSCNCPTDYALSLSSDEVQLEGQVIAKPTTVC